MKKILSLVLAAAMLTTTAFAATDIGVGTTTVAANPGATLRVYGDSFESDKSLNLGKKDWHFSSEYLTISSKSFEKGANLVKEVKINDNEMSVDIVLNKNYDLFAPNGDNLVIKKLAVKGKQNYDVNGDKKYDTESGDIKKGTEYEYVGSKNLKVGYPKVKINLDGSEGSVVAYQKDTLVEFVAKGGVSYETVSLDDIADIYLEGRVYDGDKVYVDVDNDVNKDILKAAADDADIRFYNITTNGFPTANTIQLAAEEDEFVYKIVDGKITASGLKWSADDYAWVGKIRSSVSYVVSDVELKAAPATSGDATTGNPDTGANDVVGVAAALAVVSLVAAGAVSLKK